MIKILLDPVDFDALHLSVLANGGIGGVGRWQEDKVTPRCVVGHANWLEGLGESIDGYDSPMTKRLARAQLTYSLNDQYAKDQMPWEDYIKLLNIDVREVA